MRNAERFVRASAGSVLAQREVDLELIVVDDGSTDRSAAVVSDIGDDRVRLIKGPQRGISAAFNAGVGAAGGAYLARCDADDFYRPGRLARQRRWLDERPAFVAVGAGYAYLDARGRYGVDRIVGAGTSDVTDELLQGIGRSHMCAYLFRAEAVRAIGGCREWFVTSEDADLQYRLAEHGRVGYDAFDAYGYRLHDSSITHTQKHRQKQWYADVAKQFLEQRRRDGIDDLMRGTPPMFNEASDSADATESGADELADWMTSRSWQQHRDGRRGAALATGLRMVRLRPTRARGWKNLLLLAIKP
jgi:glycosyltransferase involved in cell wall biosynthesis